VPDPVIEPRERVVEGRARVVAQAEEHLDLVQGEHADERFGAGHLGHAGMVSDPDRPRVGRGCEDN
jgi:hypothetical protein